MGYETPPVSRAAERHGPFHLERQVAGAGGGGVRITGVYRTVWGRWRRAISIIAVVGMALLLCGTVIDAVPGRGVIIDLRQFPPVLTGSAATLSGLGLVALAVLCWLAFPVLTWRRFHRLEIDAGPEELIIRQILPTGEQIAGRWKPTDVERIVVAQYELTVQPREGAPLNLTIGGPWTGSIWLADQIGAATGIATAGIGRA